MNIRKSLAAFGLAVMIPAVAACGADAASTSAEPVATSSSSASQDSATAASGAVPEGPSLGGGRGPGGSVDTSSVTTEEQLVALIKDAYGDAGLGLHRGHQPVEDVLNEVLTVSHDELHVRMEEQGQNLAAVAEDIGVDPQTLIDALVASRSSAIGNLLTAGTITQEQADAYLEALEEAFAFRVTWDGEESTPTFSGIDV